jgi:hypothetical protein
MSYFNKFPKIDYTLYGDNRTVKIPDFSLYAKALDRGIEGAAAYQWYDIQEQRPDQVSYALYGSTEYYWTFFVINDHLKSGNNGWPLSEDAFAKYIEENYNGFTITPYRGLDSNQVPHPPDYNAIAGRFPIGTILRNNSNVEAKVIKRVAELNQLVCQYTTEGNFTEGEPLLAIEQSDNFDQYNIYDNWDLREWKNSAHHYEDDDGNYVTSGLNTERSNTIVTYLDYETSLNDQNRRIRALRKEYVEQFSTAYRRILNNG